MYQGKKVIVLAEPMWSEGHFETQMQLFLSVLLPEECRLIVLCAEPDRVMGWLADQMPEYKKSAFAAHFTVSNRNGKKCYKRGQLWSYLSETVKKAEEDSGWNVDLVFITFLDILVDGSWRTLGFRAGFDYQWAGLYFLPSFFRYKSNIIRRAIQLVNNTIFYRIKNCNGIGILDEGIYSTMKERVKDCELFVFPDVTDERLPDCIPEHINRIRLDAGNRTIIGFVGVLQKRKGLLNYLRAMQAIDPTKCYFLLAGHLPLNEYTPAEQAEINRLLADQDGKNRHFELNYIRDPVEFNAYINICDVLYIAYEGFYHSSGIMTKAAVFEKPVIATKGYCMGERVDKYRLGLTVAEGNITEIIEAIETLAEEKARKQIVSEAKFDYYYDYHNANMLQDVLCRMLSV